MSEFYSNLITGFEHILNINGYDHVLFVIALCSIYGSRQWRSLIIVVSAFTVGHSITLLLAALKVVVAPEGVIEFLVPVTIFITTISNMVRPVEKLQHKRIQLNYLYAMIFGLIHGFAFSYFYTGMYKDTSRLVTNLLAFNVGVELGQLLVVLVVVVFSGIITNLFGVERRDWRLVINGAVAGVSLTMILEALF